VAQRLDLTRRTLVGDQVTLSDSAGAASVSAAGVVAYRSTGSANRQLRWVDRAGKDLGSLGAVERADVLLGSPRVSPDGRRAAVRRNVKGNEDLWLLDGTRTSRFTFDPAFDRNTAWSPDGSRIAFHSNRSGMSNLYTKLASGAAPETLLLESPYDETLSDWSADGGFVLYHSRDPITDMDLWVLPLSGERKPWLLLKTDFTERHGQFSPDGRWIAYMSNESGRSEIYIRPFALPAADSNAREANAIAVAARAGGQWQVSSEGGIFPRWARDGRELYYIGPEGQMMAAPIRVSGDSIEPGAPVALFETRISEGGEDIGQGTQFDVTRDGRFLINTDVDEGTAPITLLLNWTPPGTK
jgi:dipeptidyl aminopeptidase/acylaminoacyl peptidase